MPEKRKDLGYYKFHTTAVTWFRAKQICEQEGAHLLILNSEREFTAIKAVWDTYPKLFSGGQNNFMHVGLHDLLQEGDFVTLNGKISLTDLTAFVTYFKLHCDTRRRTGRAIIPNSFRINVKLTIKQYLAQIKLLFLLHN